MKSVLSVDVAKGKSMILLMNSEGEILIDAKEIKHNLIEFDALENEIKALAIDDLTVFMESTSIYHLPVERYFKSKGYKTLVINSLTTKNNFDTLRKTKTDKKDCTRLAKLFFVNEVEYHDLPKDDLYANLKVIVRHYNYLINKNIDCKNRYKRLINVCFPEFEEIFKTRIYNDATLDFISKFPHPDIVKEKRKDLLFNTLFGFARKKAFYEKQVELLKTAANSSYPGVDRNHGDVKNLSRMAIMIKNNNKEIENVRAEMIELARQSPYFDIINSVPGLGEILTSELLGELGDITRFDTAKQLIAFCGLDPTIAQSGKSINKHGPISKRGNKYSRWVLFNCSEVIVRVGATWYNEHPVYIYYQKKKAEGKHFYESLTACSTKVLRMLYSMCKNNTAFKIN